MSARPFAPPLAAGPWARARWLVIAPHADDETLGAGALIASAQRRGRLGGVVYLTDGVGSHPHPDATSKLRLAALRRREASASLRVLAGMDAPPPLFLGWPDAQPFSSGDQRFAAARQRLAALCRRRRIDAIAVTAAHEPHCDHQAACRLAYAVAASARRPVTVFEYLVWAPEPPPQRYRTLRTEPMAKSRRLAALLAHRSQVGPCFGKGFRLPAAHFAMRPDDTLYTLARPWAQP